MITNEIVEYANRILKQYKEETSSHYTRSTSDLSPLEQWLLKQMYQETKTRVYKLAEWGKRTGIGTPYDLIRYVYNLYDKKEIRGLDDLLE